MSKTREKKQEIKDIWTLIKESNSEKKEEKSSRDMHVVVIGARGSGKSTLIRSYIAKDSDSKGIKPTTGLDYNYQKTQTAVGQNVLHFWEVGGGRSLAQLLDIPLTPERMVHMQVVLVVDLSKPEEITDDVNYWLRALRTRIGNRMRQMKEKKLTVGPKLTARANKRFGENHPDLSQVTLSVVPIMIVANKWDVFLSRFNSNPDQLQTMSHTLRALAHSTGATLMYSSSVSPHKSLLQNFRLRIARFSSGRVDSQPNITDHTKPIMIASPGSDTFDAIGSSVNGPGVAGWIQTCNRAFPRSSDSKQSGDTDTDLPPLQLNPEPLVDTMLAQRNEDLTRKEREKELERKLKSSDRNR